MLEIRKVDGALEIYKPPPKIITIKINPKDVGFFPSFSKAAKVKAIIKPVEK